MFNTFDLLVQFDEKYFVARDKDYYIRFKEQADALTQQFYNLSFLLETPGQKKLLDTTIQIFDEYLLWFESKVSDEKGKKTINYEGLIDERTPFLSMIVNNLENIMTISRKVVNEKTDLSRQMTQQIFLVTIFTTILTFIIGLIISILNTRSIKQSVGRLQAKTKKIAQGHFEEIQTLKGPKEIRDLAVYFNTMSRKLKELDGLKADFISHVSHELRTPLTSIKEASAMLSKGYYKDDPAKQNELLILIDEECQRLLNSVIRVLDYSKMEARKMEYRIRNQYLPDVLRKSILKLAPLAQKKKITLEFSPPPQNLPFVDIDQDRIIEVLDNIIGNALKFTPEMGKVVVSCRFLEKENVIQVAIRDNGPGIGVEHLEKIFYRFKQIDNGLNAHMGTGLGLSISKYIIKAHGGKIWADSQKTRGTTVSFSLPVVS